MKRVMNVAGAVLSLLAPHGFAQEAVNFSAVLRVDDGAPRYLQYEVGLDSSRLVRIDDDYLIEFTAPDVVSDDTRAVVRLFRLDGSEYKVLHTSRQNLTGMNTRQVGYRLCEGRVTFMSPSPDFPADCASGN